MTNLYALLAQQLGNCNILQRKNFNAIHLVLVNIRQHLDVDGLKNNDLENNEDKIAKRFINLLDISFEANEIEITKSSGGDDAFDNLTGAPMDIFGALS